MKVIQEENESHDAYVELQEWAETEEPTWEYWTRGTARSRYSWRDGEMKWWNTTLNSCDKRDEMKAATGDTESSWSVSRGVNCLSVSWSVSRIVSSHIRANSTFHFQTFIMILNLHICFYWITLPGSPSETECGLNLPPAVGKWVCEMGRRASSLSSSGTWWNMEHYWTGLDDTWRDRYQRG